jgi:hypothetical protein
MEAKEKAKELFNKMDMIIYTEQDNWKIQCIRCALIAVDEIINTLDSERIIYGSEYCFEENNYWTEVKQEIEKL